MAVTKCKICAKSFYVKPSHQKLGWGKFCSSDCRSRAQFNGKELFCFICNKKIYRSLAKLKHSKSGKHFCSRSCQTKWRNSLFTGENNINWTGGSSSYRDIFFRTNRSVKCILCGFADKRALSVHHVDHNRKNNKLSNLVCVCQNCHFLIHKDIKLDAKVKSMKV